MATVAVGALALLLVVVQGTWTRRVDSARAVSLETFNHALGDTIQAFSQLVDSARTGVDRDHYLHAIVKEAKSLLPLESPRVCVYLLEGREGEEATEYLKYAAHAGRNDNPRSEFSPGTPHGDAAISVARGTTDRLVDDIHKRGQPIECGENAIYRSFMQVPLSRGPRPWGILTVDTTRKTRFTDEHRSVARTIARFIELANDKVAEAADDVQPEMREAQQQLEEAELAASVSPQMSVQEGTFKEEGR